MLTVESVAAFLRSRGITEEIMHGEEEPEMPDRVVLLTPTGGPGGSKELVFEQASVQVRCRGNQNDPADAEALGDRVDRVLMGTIPPLVVGGRHVTSVQWLGGLPAVVGRDDARRYQTSASYVFEIAR